MPIYELVLSQSPPSSRPPVTGYNISHNITGSVMVDFTNDTNFSVEDVDPGAYFFTVHAVNTFGRGKENTSSITG